MSDELKPLKHNMPILGNLDDLTVKVQEMPCRMFWNVHERQAKRNHGQSLERLRARGGLSACECLAVLTCQSYHKMDSQYAHRTLYAMRSFFNHARRTPEAVKGVAEALEEMLGTFWNSDVSAFLAEEKAHAALKAYKMHIGE